MSFQGPGGGISGTSNQFAVGYAQSSGYAGYAGGAGNINGYAPQAGYANQAAATAQTLQLVSASSSTWGWQGQNTTPAWLWGSNQGNSDTVYAPGNLSVGYAGYAGSAGNINGYAPSAGNATYANQATYAANLGVQGIGGSTWAWAGQPGIPNHYWGSNQGGYHAVWQANQGYVGYAGSAGNINGYAPQAGYAGYAGSAGNINGYAPVAGNTTNSTAYLRVWRSASGNTSGVAGFQQQSQNGIRINFTFISYQ